MAADASRELVALAARLKGAPAQLRRDTLRGFRTAAVPLIADVRRAAEDKLPKAGGLNMAVANQPVKVRNRLTGRNPSVRLVDQGPGVSHTNEGKVRHPYWGRWAKNAPTQDIPQARGWWTDTLVHGKPVVEAEMNRVMRAVAYRIMVR